MIYLAGTDFSHLTNEELINGIKALNLPDYIRSKAYGIDVRETLAQMTEMLMQLAYNQGMNTQQAQDFVYRINNKIDKGEVAMSDLTQEVKLAMTGGSVAVVGEDAVGTVNIIDGAVTSDKVKGYIEADKLIGVSENTYSTANLFDKTKITKGGYFNSSGVFVSNSKYAYSDYIPVINTVYRKSNTNSAVYYDSEKQFVSGHTGGNTLDIKSSNISYVVLNLEIQEADTFMFSEENKWASEYVPFRTYSINPDIFDMDVKVSSKHSNNLFDKTKITKGGYFRSDGTFVSNKNYAYSDYIPVDRFIEYTKTDNGSATYYDENREYVVGHSGGTDVYVSNLRVKYIVLNIPIAMVDYYQFSEKSKWSDTYAPYETKGYKLGDRWSIAGESIDGVANVGDSQNPKYEFDERWLPDGISVEKRPSVNLFNKDDVTEGYYNTLNEFVDDSRYVMSNYIEIDRGFTYRKTNSGTILYFDKDFNFINGYIVQEQRVSNSKIAYAKISVQKSLLDTYMFTKLGDWSEEYIPYAIDYHTFDETKWGVGGWKQEVKPLITSATTPPIKLDLEDWSGYEQPYHPSVLYLPNGFGGHKYWMSQTPFPLGASPSQDRWECPVVYHSDNGYDWQVVPNANPLDDLTEDDIVNGNYLSDAHLVYRSDLNRLECWYRKTVFLDNNNRATNIFRKVSTDGFNWSEREEVVPAMGSHGVNFWRSHSVLWDNTKKVYRVWKQTDTEINYVEVDSNTMSLSGQTPIKLDYDYPHWHIDVNYFNNAYHLIIYSMTLDELAYYQSTDGINFKFVKTLMSTKDSHPLYSSGLYRACSILDHEGKIRVYTSSTSALNKQNIFVVTSDSFEEIQPVEKLKANMIVFSDGKTLEDTMRTLV